MKLNSAKWLKKTGIILLFSLIITLVATNCSELNSKVVDPPGQTADTGKIPTAASSTTIRPTNEIESENSAPNRLINESSPYLLQHAYDPVDWYPWGEAAFEKARIENKPIFLSIGYSTCHWCHVMKEESFNNPETANLLNDTFVNIIVDKEERPDIDVLYSAISVSMNGSSGWPLNVIMTYDQKPFYITSYLPKENSFGRIGLLDLIPQLQTAWDDENNELNDISEQVADKVKQIASVSRRGELPLNAALLENTFDQLGRQFDEQNSGFGLEAKFPVPHKLLFLLRYWDRTGDKQALDMVESSLQAMRRGGVYDQLGFGFHRYTIDAAWQLPHFEKMLYDQALLSMVYTEAYQATGKTEYAQTAHEVLAYVLRELTAPDGGFFSAEDADSEEREGGFYLWTIDEIRSILTNDEEADLFITAYNVTEGGNFSEAILGEHSSENVLFINRSFSELAKEFQILEVELVSRLDTAREKLFEARAIRFPLHRDEKILADWNGLMISAFAKAGQVFNQPIYIKTAQDAADFVMNEMRDENGRLYHRYFDNAADVSANVDDYAFMTWGLIDLYESTFDVRYLENALEFSEDLLDHFLDEEEGGFYFTPDYGEVLIARQKVSKDRDFPSGNSAAMLNFLRLGRMTANPDLEATAGDIVQAFALQIDGAPSDYALLLSAVDFGIGPYFEIVIAGDPLASDTREMVSTLRSKYIPNKVVLLRPPGESPEILRLAEYLKYNTLRDGLATAYVCINYQCEFPTTDTKKMLELLGK